MQELGDRFFRTRNAIGIFFVKVAVAAGQPSGNQLSANISQQGEASSVGETMRIKANGLRLKTNIHRSATLSSHPVLIVVLHGDLLGVRAVPPTTYHYVFAREAAAKMNDLVAVAVLRPGYRDASGEHSEGERGLTTGDNYTPEVVDAIAQAIDQLKDRFHPSRTVLAGHSGGAAITGDLIGRWPSEVMERSWFHAPVTWRRGAST